MHDSLTTDQFRQLVQLNRKLNRILGIETVQRPAKPAAQTPAARDASTALLLKILRPNQ